MAKLTAWILAPLCLIMVVAMVNGAAVPPKIDPHKEAEIIAVESTDSLLPDENLVVKIQKDVALIRSTFDQVKNVRNTGRKYLGKTSVADYNAKVLEKINKTKFGPATVESEQDGKTVLTFPKPYNPDKLADALKKEGVKASSVWNYVDLDFGNIEYKEETKEYEFREGLENCKPTCADNHFYTFEIKNGKVELTGEHATDIPEPPRVVYEKQ